MKVKITTRHFILRGLQGIWSASTISQDSNPPSNPPPPVFLSTSHLVLGRPPAVPSFDYGLMSACNRIREEILGRLYSASFRDLDRAPTCSDSHCYAALPNKHKAKAHGPLYLACCWFPPSLRSSRSNKGHKSKREEIEGASMINRVVPTTRNWLIKNIIPLREPSTSGPTPKTPAG